jgi:hypothetical protein
VWEVVKKPGAFAVTANGIAIGVMHVGLAVNTCRLLLAGELDSSN